MAKNDEQIARLEQELKDLLSQADQVFDDFEKKMTALEKKRNKFLLKISQEKDQEGINQIINSLKT
jgi:hypothetical protein